MARVHPVAPVLALMMSCVPVVAASPATLAELDAELARIGTLGSAADRRAAIDTLWTGLTAAGQVPFRDGDQVAFLYRSTTAGSVAVAGDPTRWQPSIAASRRPGTDLWLARATLPVDARIDYKLVVDNAFILDPANPHQQWSGFGPNSELRMPGYVFPDETLPRPGVARGTLGAAQTLPGGPANGNVRFRVYTPAGFDPARSADLPTVYVTDGHEYADEKLGAMTTVLDNLIADGRLRPTLAVFIDPRDPATGNNRRMDQLGGPGKAAFADFVAGTLRQHIEATLPASDDADDRVVMGVSLGGLFAAFAGARHADVFGKVAAKSPAFWFDPTIYDTYRDNAETLREALVVYLSAGTINDGDGGPTMSRLLTDAGVDFAYGELSQGHSWGQWKGQIDDALIHLIGPPVEVPEPAAALPLAGALLARRRR